MRKISLQICSLIAALAWAAPVMALDQDPISNGNTLARGATGSGFESVYSNPALLGVERMPKGGLLLFPITNYGLAEWSDKLALSPFQPYWTLGDSSGVSHLFSNILNGSFNLKPGSDSATAAQNSATLTKEFKGGVNLYGAARASLLTFANNRIAFDVTTHAEDEIHISEAPLMMIFSDTKGLLKGNKLDFSDQKEDGIWATDFSLQLGLPLTIPALQDFFNFRYGAGGVGLKYVMGHSLFQERVNKGTISYDAASNLMSVDANMSVASTGTGLHDYWDMSNPFKNGLPVNGHGVGVEIGGILYDELGALSINVQNLGVIFWPNVDTVNYRFQSNNLTVYQMIQAITAHTQKDSILTSGAQNGQISSYSKFGGGENLVTLLPLNINIGYSRTWDFTKLSNPIWKDFADYGTAAVDYQQFLVPDPGCSYIPRFTLGGEAGALHSFVPLRMGFVFGGPEGLASALGMGLNFKYVSLQASYKAIGTGYFWPKRGVELAGGININWGLFVDSDHDGIPDYRDKCPHDPEDFDGFEDGDGCPDYDNDQDGIPDSLDKCPNVPEDKDNFQDQDGCPDYDNDNDGIPDSLDKCPNDKEDFDGFQDQDGCPDFDNDKDGIPDTLDKCPNLPEDIDMFEDEDGCPDYDNDKDGIPDSLDKCIMEPENYNGYKDDDGCPDSLIRPTAKETKILNTKLRSINFKTGSAELLPVSYAGLDYIVKFLQQYPSLRYEVQGHTDNQGKDETNLVLSAARAGSVRAYLIAKGIPDSNLVAIGYGKTQPIADNKTATGRALNRRVEFKIIESESVYGALKSQELLLRDQIKAAKVKGVKW